MNRIAKAKSPPAIHLKAIARHYPDTMAVTWGLLLIEAILALGFPLAIGLAVDGLIAGRETELWLLGGLCLAVLLVGAGRRFFDTRAYAVIYRDLAQTLYRREKSCGADLSRVSARVGLLDEVVSFFEDDLPALLEGLVALTGVILVLAWIDYSLMASCLAASLAILLIYLVAESRIFALNLGQNDELERQVRILKTGRERKFDLHIRKLMRWNIRLSDLETLNFSAVWLVLAGLLIWAVWLTVGNEELSYGAKITSIMYVFQYIEAIMAIPLLYAQLIRLKEITRRLEGRGEFISEAD